MISLVTLVLAVVAVGSNGHIIPYSGVAPYTYTGAPVTYTVSPTTYSVAPTQYVAGSSQYVAAVPHKYVAAAPAPIQYVGPTPIGYAAQAPFQLAASAPIQYVAPGPIQQVAVVPSTSQSQYHAQDEFGGYSFGHAGGQITRKEDRDHFGNVQGSYSYVDPEGKIQTTLYTAGAEGFQVAATNLPVAPLAVEAVVPEAIGETPEVVAARSAFQAIFDKAVVDNQASAAPEEAAAAVPEEAAAATPVRRKRSTPVVAVHGTPTYPYLYNNVFGSHHNFAPTVYSGFPAHSVAPLSYTAGVGHAISPFTYSAGVPYNSGVVTYAGGAVPASTTGLRNAELLRVVNNPGHATSYRVL